MQKATAQTWHSEGRAEALLIRVLPSLAEFAFILPIFLLFQVFSGSKILLADADLGWHIRVGDWILKHHAVPHVDLFSFTRPNQPWCAWEWGWDTLAALIHSQFGLAGIVFANSIVLGVVSVLLFRLTLRACGNGLLAFGLTTVAMCASMVHWLARPHLLSWVFLLLFAHFLASAENGSKRALFAMPISMVFWVNLHGSFFLGIVMIGIAALSPYVDLLLSPKPHFSEACRKTKPYLVCAAVCCAATFMNPYGWHLHQHVLSYFGDSKQMNLMQEFHSISFHQTVALFFEAMLILGLPACAWSMKQRNWRDAITLVVFAHLALFSVRNVPLFVFLSAPVAASMISSALRRTTRASFLGSIGTKLRTIGTDLAIFESHWRLHLLPAAAIVFLAVSFTNVRPGFESRFDPGRLPESAVAVIQRTGAHRVFSSDQWSAFLLYRLSPSIRVFIDDRSDFYGSELVSRAREILNAHWDYESDLERFSTDMVVVPPATPLCTVLKRSEHWNDIFDDGSVVIFTARPKRQNSHFEG